MNFICSTIAILLTLSPLAQATEPPVLQVGMDLTYPPFETIGPDGKPVGVSLDLASALATDLGRPLEIQNIPFIGLIPALKSGKIDLIISSMTATPERARQVAFSQPYLSTGLGALLPAASTAQNLADLDQADHTIVVRQGTTGEVFARKRLSQARILTLEKTSACVIEVIQGKASAFIYDQMSVFQNAQRNPKKTRALLAPLQSEFWAIALRPENKKLLGEVNDFLLKFRAEGGFEKLADQYLAEEKEAFAQQGIPFFF